MARDVTEPLDWFAADATDNELTVPDWVRREPTAVWSGDATTMPALTLDSAALAAPPWETSEETSDNSKAMTLYAVTTVLLLGVLFGMFFVFGGRLDASATRTPGSRISLAVTGGQLPQIFHFGAKPIHSALRQQVPPKRSKPATPPKQTQKPSSNNGGSLWSSDCAQAPTLAPAWPPDLPDAPVDPIMITESGTSLWAPST